MRTIDADHLKRWILSRVFKTQLNVSDVIDQIDRELTIEPEPHSGRRVYQAGYADGFQDGQSERKKGKWINIRHDNIAECDQCGITGRAWMNFCFDCGSDMREETDDQSK